MTTPSSDSDDVDLGALFSELNGLVTGQTIPLYVHMAMTMGCLLLALVAHGIVKGCLEGCCQRQVEKILKEEAQQKAQAEAKAEAEAKTKAEANAKDKARANANANANAKANAKAKANANINANANVNANANDATTLKQPDPPKSENRCEEDGADDSRKDKMTAGEKLQYLIAKMLYKVPFPRLVLLLMPSLYVYCTNAKCQMPNAKRQTPNAGVGVAYILRSFSI